MSESGRTPLLQGDALQGKGKLRPSQLDTIRSMQQSEEKGASVVGFENNLGTAMRCAAACGVTSIPLLIPGMVPNAGWAAGIQCAIQYIVFTIYGDLGTTIMYAWQGFAGTLLAVGISHVMHAIMPGGAAGDAYDPFIAHAANVFVIVMGLWCNFSMNVTMFMLSYHCYFHMDLLNPGATSEYNDSWAIDWNSYPMVTQVCATAGVIISVIAMILPRPKLASTRAREASLQSVSILNQLMLDMNAYYCRHTPSVEIYRTEKSIHDIRSFVNSMDAALSGSWWEACFVDFGNFSVGAKIRQLLTRHMGLMHRMLDNADALYNSISKEGFGDIHVKCMDAMAPEVDALLHAAGDLLSKSTSAATDAVLNEEETVDLEDAIVKTRQAMEAVATKFYQVRQELSPEKVIDTSLQSENFYFYGITLYARFAIDYADCLLAHEVAVTSFTDMIISGIKSTLDLSTVVRDHDYRSFVIRNSISVLFCFYMGMYLFAYNATAAGTVSLLLSNFAGSALIKNLGRLQGVVLGNIFPHVMTQVIGNSCFAPRIIAQAAVTFGFLTLTNYVYYASAAFGFIGCLAGAFGGPILAYQCTADELEGAAATAAENTFELGAYTKILQCAICCLVLVAVDLVLAPERASSKAIDETSRALVRLDGAVNAIFQKRNFDGTLVDPRSVTNRYFGKMKFADHIGMVKVLDFAERDPSTIMKHTDCAATMGVEADKEARNHRTPWNVPFFNAVTGYIRSVRDNVILIESALAGSDDDYDDIFDKLRSLSTFHSLYEDLMALLDEALTMIELVNRNETGKNNYHIVKKMIDKGIGTLDGVPQLIDEVNSKLTYPPEGDYAKTLEDDEIVRTIVILTLLETIAEECGGIIKDALMHV